MTIDNRYPILKTTPRCSALRQTYPRRRTFNPSSISGARYTVQVALHSFSTNTYLLNANSHGNVSEEAASEMMERLNVEASFRAITIGLALRQDSLMALQAMPFGYKPRIRGRAVGPRSWVDDKI